jgi:hypothetical protein
MNTYKGGDVTIATRQTMFVFALMPMAHATRHA